MILGSDGLLEVILTFDFLRVVVSAGSVRKGRKQTKKACLLILMNIFILLRQI